MENVKEFIRLEREIINDTEITFAEKIRQLELLAGEKLR